MFVPLPQKLRADLPKSALLVVAGIAAGLAVNRMRPNPVPWEHTPKTVSLNDAVVRLTGTLAVGPAGQPASIEADALAAVAGDSRVVLLDVRPDLFFEDGHIPGAQNLPRAALESRYPAMKPALAAARAVVVYCAGSGCEEAELMAGALTRLGHRHVAVYRGGWDEWTAASRPVAREGV